MTTITIMATNDDDALKRGRAFAMNYNVELWDGGRKVALVPSRRRQETGPPKRS